MATPPSQPVVLVTGSEGLIGHAVSERLNPRYAVVGTDRAQPWEGSAEDFVFMDVTSDASVRQGLDAVRARYGARLASVVHLAAYYDFSGAESPMYQEVTVEGTRRLLRELRRQGFEVEQFLFVSSVLVHAPVEPGETLTEDAPLEGTWAYPRSKIETEGVIREERGPIPAVLLRVAGVYTDEGQQPTLVQQIRRIYERDLESHLFPGDVRTGQALVHLDDAVDALVRAVDRRGELPEEVAIIVGEPEPPTYEALQDRIGGLLWGHDWATLRIPESVAKAGAWVQDRLPGESFIKPFMVELADAHYAYDISRARELLGWEPRRRLIDTVPAIVGRLRDDPAAWYEANGLEPPARLPDLPPPISDAERRDDRIPPGWDYNPAAWSQRLPIVGLALLGTAIAGYLSLYQLGLVADVWEPFFGDGSRTILDSRVSHVLPIPDALLGAISYALDAAAGAAGGTRRWRTMPWLVVLFGLLVGPLGLVSLLLVVLQPVLFDAWCTLCLASAVVSTLMIGPAMDEVLASLQHLRRVRDGGGSLWRAFWGFRA